MFFYEEPLHLDDEFRAAGLTALIGCGVAPGVTTRLHVVAVDERYVIVSGRGLMETGGVRAEVGPGDAVLIPAGVPQRIANVGAEDLVFHCVCTPRFTPEAYRDVEAEVRPAPLP